MGEIPITVFPNWLIPFVNSFLSSLFWQSIVFFVILGLLVVINFNRHKDLVDHIQYLTEFSYLQILITTTAVKRVSKPDLRVELEPTKTELQSLNELLLRGYWLMFFSTWPQVKITLQNEAEDIFLGTSSPDVKRLWGNFIRASRKNDKVDSARKQLGVNVNNLNHFMWLPYLTAAAHTIIDYIEKHGKFHGDIDSLPSK